MAKRRHYNNSRRRNNGFDYHSYNNKRLGVLENEIGHKALGKIKTHFFNLSTSSFDQLLQEYGNKHGASAKSYAKKTYSKWKSREVDLSGETQEKLIDLVPRFLSTEQRTSILEDIVAHNEPDKPSQEFLVKAADPQVGFSEVRAFLQQNTNPDSLAYLSTKAMNRAKWLFDNDSTVVRSILAKLSGAQDANQRTTALRELELLEKTISSGQVKSASQKFEFPSCRVKITVRPKGLLESLRDWL